MENLFSYAFISLCCIIAAEYVNAYSRVRSWNWGVFGVLLFALLNVAVDVVLVEYFLGEEIDRR